MNRKTRNILRIAIVVAVLVAAALLAYPTVSYWWNGVRQREIVAKYDQAVSEVDTSRYDELLSAADEYNAELAKTGVVWDMSDEQMATYNGLLDVTGTGMMGYLKIPKIDVVVPIYHGTENDVLAEAVGHIAGTSLPVGGVGTHCSVSGHRGLPTPRLLADLGMVQVGDTFTVTVLDRVLTYEVDQIRTVLPQNLGDLAIDPDQDYVTIVTCTPYGVNSHRLLVRGHRVDNQTGAASVTADAVQVQPNLVAAFVSGLVVVGTLVVVVLLLSRRIRHQENDDSTSSGGE